MSDHGDSYRVLLRGEFGRDRTFVDFSRRDHGFPPGLEDEAARTWAAARSGGHGAKLFDGPMCRLVSACETPRGLELRLEQTSYRWFVASNMRHPEWASVHGVEAMANPLGVSAALVTNDGRLVLARRAAWVAYHPGRLHPIAGTVEPRDGGNPFDALDRELAEELSGIGSGGPNAILGIVEDRQLGQPEAIIHVATSVDAARLRCRNDEAERLELVSLNAMPPEELWSAMTPVARACWTLAPEIRAAGAAEV